jgi:uncharacterized protein (TIGR03492 family)
VLFVSNGHGEVAIAQRIAREMPQDIACDHLALVGGPAQDERERILREVGPRRAMPSGGLVAMGNVRNIVRDVSAGLIGHTLAQLRFLHSAGRTYCVAIAVGDVYALVMALRARADATVYVGTAKSVFVAPYGPFEERVIAKAQAVFVRDAATAQRLQTHGIGARVANVIVDLYARDGGAEIDAPFDPRLVLFPGSREAAYDDAVALCRIVRELARARARVGALLSVAPALDATRMAAKLARDGWPVRHHADEQSPFSLFIGERETVRAWRGPIAAMLKGASIVLGQAGTANEGAAAAGLPVIALERARAHAWYRKRQIGLLGEALLVVSADERAAAREIAELLEDDARRARMGQIGRERMGPPGGAKLIADEVVRLCG